MTLMEVAGIMSNLIAVIIFMYLVCKLSSKIDTNTRKDAPQNTRDATDAEKSFFIARYQQVGRSIYSKKYRLEVEHMAETLKVTKGTLTDVRIKKLNNRAVSGTTISIDGISYRGLDISIGKGECGKVIDDYPIGSEMLVFCAKDISGKYKIITAALEQTVKKDNGDF